MIIYMLFNTITEKAYVGQTVHTLNDRVNSHWQNAKNESETPVHKAMAEWNNRDLWLAVVLQNCYSTAELNENEKYWIRICDTQNPSVGYNIRVGGQGETKKLTRHRRAVDMTPQEREQFREWGRKGAAASRLRVSAA